MTLVSLIAAMVAAGMSQDPAGGQTLTREQAQARLADCGSRRFESVAEFEIGGKPKRSRLALCAKDSDTDGEWIATLEKNEAFIKSQTALPESARFKLLSDLRGEIDRLKASQPSVPVAGAASLTLPKAAVVAPASDFDVAALPPLPAPNRPGAAVSVPAIASTASSVPARPKGLRPKLSVKCAVPGGSPIPCDYLSLDDMFVVEADENLASPLTLTFRRPKSGEVAEVAIRKLRQGDTVRFKVPAPMCKGVGKTTFDVQVRGAGTGGLPYDDVLGPFRKAC